MDRAFPDTIRHRLQKFEQSIDTISCHPEGPGDQGHGYASAPFHEKYMISAMLDSFDGSRSDHEVLVSEYLRITQKLEAYVTGCGPQYHDRLFEDLRYYTHAYHAAVCHAHLGQMSPDRARDISMRELIGELYRELKDDYDLSDIEGLIALLDDNLTPWAPVPESMQGDGRTPLPGRSQSSPEGKYSSVKKKTRPAPSE